MRRLLGDGLIRAAGGLGRIGAAVAAASPGGEAGRRVLFTGGARSGKSLAAEHSVAALAGTRPVTYVATSLPRPDDAAWARRVALHRERRPAGWTTTESLDVAALLDSAPGPLLIDCATLWLGAVWTEPDRQCRVDDLVRAWTGARGVAVFVTNEVGSGVHPMTELGRDFADELGRLNARLADAADEAWLLVAGQPLRLR